MIYPGLKGKNVIVTGASRAKGIGAAICLAFAEQGSNVFFTTHPTYDASQYQDAKESDSEKLLQNLHALGVRAEKLELDLSKPKAAEVVLNEASRYLGNIDTLVNNAAYSTRDGYQNLDDVALDTHYAVNVRAMALLSVGFAKRFKGQQGCIVNMTSGQSLGAMPGELAYVASKGAIEAFTRTLAAEVAHLGITVNAVDPGATDTGWMTEEFRQTLTQTMRMGRVGQPRDAAQLIVFLASEAGAWITGEVMHSRGA